MIKRVQCAYDIYKSQEERNNISVCLSPTERDHFLDQVSGEGRR